MGKSLKNSVTPDEMYDAYGADTLRLYEMAMGPLDQSRPWDDPRRRRHVPLPAAGVAQRRRRGAPASVRVVDDAGRRRRRAALLHRTIADVRDDMEALRFNTAIAKLIELNNHLTKASPARPAARGGRAAGADAGPAGPAHRRGAVDPPRPRRVAGLARPSRWPIRPAWSSTTVEIPVQINGKVRARVAVPVDADAAVLEAAARSEPKVAELLAGATVRRVVAVPGRLVNFVLG